MPCYCGQLLGFNGLPFMILKIRKEAKGLYFESVKGKGWLKDSLSLPDLIHALKPSKVVVLDKPREKAKKSL